MFLVTSPACRAHRTAPLGAIPVPSSFTRPCQPNHPPTQPIATAKLPMATIATGQPHGVYRCHAIPSTPPDEREKVHVLLQQARLTSKYHRWQAVRPAQRRVRRLRGRNDRSDHRPLGPSGLRAKALEPSHHLISTFGVYWRHSPRDSSNTKKLPTTRTRTWNFTAKSSVICGRSRDTWPRARRRKLCFT